MTQRLADGGFLFPKALPEHGRFIYKALLTRLKFLSAAKKGSLIFAAWQNCLSLAYQKHAEIELVEMFSIHGTVNTVTILTDRVSGENKGYGFITLTDDAGAERGQELHIMWHMQRDIEVIARR